MAERPPSQIIKAKAQLAKHLSGETSLVGVGIGATSSGQYEIVVFVAEETSPLLAKVPHFWQGFPVRTAVTGTPKKFSNKVKVARRR